MQAQKVTVTIVVEVLSIDVVEGLVFDAVKNIKEEYETGALQANDGDKVTWETKKENVSF